MNPRDLTPEDIASILSDEILINNGILSESEFLAEQTPPAPSGPPAPTAAPGAASSNLPALGEVDRSTVDAIIQCAEALTNPQRKDEALRLLSKWVKFVEKQMGSTKAPPPPPPPPPPAPTASAPKAAPPRAPSAVGNRAPSPGMAPSKAPKPLQ